MPTRAFSAEALHRVLAHSPAAPRLWIAYSGGRDSHALLHACAALRPRLPLALAAIHIDHGLHPDAPRWAAHCRGVCAALSIPCTIERVQVERGRGTSPEAAARSVRYRALAERLAAGELLATAHHRDDQAETVLLALLRGSGPHGLAGMAPRARLGAGLLIRPLLGFDREALARYARAHGLESVDDPSNQDTGLDRNRIRHRVLPLLEERWPAASATLARSAAHCAEAAELIDTASEGMLPGLAGRTPGALSVRALAALDAARRRAVLRRWLVRAGFRPPSAGRLEAIATTLLEARSDAAPQVVWPGCEVRRHRDDLVALPPLPPLPAVGLSWNPARALRLPSGLGHLRAIADEPLRQRRFVVVFGAGSARGPGAALRCRVPGRPGRGLKQLFQAAGVPSWLRPYVPLVLDEGGTLISVAGVAGCGDGRAEVRWLGHPWQGRGWLR